MRGFEKHTSSVDPVSSVTKTSVAKRAPLRLGGAVVGSLLGDTLTRTVKCAESGVSATGMARANAGSIAGAEVAEAAVAAARKEAGADS